MTATEILSQDARRYNRGPSKSHPSVADLEAHIHQLQDKLALTQHQLQVATAKLAAFRAEVVALYRKL